MTKKLAISTFDCLAVVKNGRAALSIKVNTGKKIYRTTSFTSASKPSMSNILLRKLTLKAYFMLLLTVSSFFLMSYQVPVDASKFRVFPYLQIDSTGNYVLTWFGNYPSASTLKIFSDGQLVFSKQDIIGQQVKDLDYVTFELSQSIEGLEKGSWLHKGSPIKFQVTLPDLPLNKFIDYEIILNGESFKSKFKTNPDKTDWKSLRFIVLSDSETEPLGRILRREWEPGKVAKGERPDPGNSKWAQIVGVVPINGRKVIRYPLTEKEGYSENLKIINNREIDFMLMPGDMVQGAGYQPAWDEFFRHNSGEYDKGLTTYPILPAIGNWENYGGINGGYGINEEGKFAPKVGRDKFFSYFIAGGLNALNQRKPFYRVDYGPITILTLDSSKGLPDDKRSNYLSEVKISGQQMTFWGADTQENFSLSQYQSYGGNDIFPFNEGLEQWNWTVQQLEDAYKRKQMVFVQFHHSPFSSGEHGFPMNHVQSTGQGGTPMRIYHSLFEKHKVIAVFSGHSEIFERSFVDEDNDGVGVHYYDVGIAGDGLRGEAKWMTDPSVPIRYNPFQKWSADQFEPEIWEIENGVSQLKSGGKHYGHLEVNLEKVKIEGLDYAIINFSPIHIFPVLSNDYRSFQTERRIYNDSFNLKIKLNDAIKNEDSLNKDKSTIETIKIFPNPFVDEIEISLPKDMHSITRISLFDILGKNYPLQIEERNLRQYVLKVLNLREGPYLIQIENTNNEIFNKIVINKN